MLRKSPATKKRGVKATRAPRASKRTTEPAHREGFPIVGIGASAGGLEAFGDLLRALPEDPGLAIVFIQHQDPKHASLLAEILARTTPIPVTAVHSETRVEINHIYVGPPDAEVTIQGRVLRLRPRPPAPSMPIDVFFRSLAEDQGNRAIGVILSGAASDGSNGAKAIKEEGGITFGQDDTAKVKGMPENAAASGSVDFILSPASIAEELVGIARHWYVTADAATSPRLPETDLSRLFSIIRSAHNVDFTHYKPATIERRIRRRMGLTRSETLADYLVRLDGDDKEVAQLYADMLIRVTGFFRDPVAFDALKQEILPAILADRDGNTPLRLWVPGCSTGEEVYSLVMVVLDTVTAAGRPCPVQIFGTDVNDAAIVKAREAIYPESIVADVPPASLQRYFTKTAAGYRVVKSVRDCCIFARQNLTKDPPFSRLDLISCRNLLIYLGAALQRRVMAIFNYALRPNGYLLLGSSETVGNVSDLFAVVDRKNRIYRKKPGSAGIEPGIAPGREAHEPSRIRGDATPATTLFREADLVALSRFSPAGVLIDENQEIIQFRGRTTPFLEPPSGAASFDLFKMAHEGLIGELRPAIHTARKKGAVVRREGIVIKNNGRSITVHIEVVPFTTAAKGHYQLVFFEVAAPTPRASRKQGKRVVVPAADSRQSSQLRKELRHTREYLQSVIEEQDGMNEELRSANEEIQSSNEELQSMNEELETAKEELQSTNEELTTLNEELENRNAELAEAHNDLLNLLTSIDVPLVMLDSKLRVRRFNPAAQRIMSLRLDDIGRPISTIKMAFSRDDLEDVVASVIDDLEVREVDVRDASDRWHLLRVRPYKTAENRIEGAVLVLVSGDPLKRAGEPPGERGELL